MPSFADIFNNTPVEDRGGDQLPVGNYRTKVTAAKTRESKAGNFGVIFTHVCTEEGPNEGDATFVSAYYTEKAAGLFVETLSKYGITGEMLDADTDQALATAVGQEWSVSVVQQKNKPEYTNTYLRKRLDEGTEDTAEDTPAPPAPTGKRPF